MKFTIYFAIFILVCGAIIGYQTITGIVVYRLNNKIKEKIIKIKEKIGQNITI